MARKQRKPREKLPGKSSMKAPPTLLKPGNIKTTTKINDPVGDEANTDKPAESAVVCLSHIPHGLYEDQMTKYFTQFGRVKRLRLSRSKTSGRSKGYAFIEFEYPDVAKIVAETMDGYLTNLKIMKCRVIPKDKVHPKLFKGCNRQFKASWHRETSIARHNTLLTANADRIHTAQKRRIQLMRKRNKKLEELGIEFKCDTMDEVWQNLKGPVKGVKTPKRKRKEKSTGKRKKTPPAVEDGNTSPPKKLKKEPVVTEDSSEKEEMSSLPKKAGKMTKRGETSDLSSDSSVLVTAPENSGRTGKRKASFSTEKVKAKEKDLLVETPKVNVKVKQEKTPTSLKSAVTPAKKMKTPAKSKTPVKTVGSPKAKLLKTPKGGKVKTPRSKRKSAVKK